MNVLPWVGLMLVAACGRNDPHAGHAEAPANSPATAPAAAPADEHIGHTMPAAPGAPAPDADMVMPVTVSPEAAAAIGVRTVPARAGSAATRHRAPASATFDPSRTRRVTVTAGGQLREERVPRVGEAVRAGQVLARIWLPEVHAAFEEQKVARPLGEPWTSAARSRLLALGVPAADIDAAGDSVPDTWTVRAPVSGIVVSRPAREGSWLGAGGLVAEIASTDARVVEMVTVVPPPVGTQVTLTDGANTWEATVSEILPTAGPAGRSVRLLPERLSGSDIGVGRPLTATWNGGETEGVWVPRGAVVDTGTRQLVFVAGADGYTPRPVSLGVRTADEVQVTIGLAPGEEVVAAGTFLFDSETQMQGGGHAGHGG
ncbi:MAG: efflux RND transporter periplasmic adaptor subunit [Pseudomonadota bacterium]|nr:efflux RND transporter periplasmic adaptor subunit [Pseudomonadota bacterium]